MCQSSLCPHFRNDAGCAPDAYTAIVGSNSETLSSAVETERVRPPPQSPSSCLAKWLTTPYRPYPAPPLLLLRL